MAVIELQTYHTRYIDVPRELEYLASVAPSRPFSFVGGYVRDMFLGGPRNDIDVCVNPGDPHRFHEYIGRSYTMTSKRNAFRGFYVVGLPTRSVGIDFIENADANLYAPHTFDFTVNMLALKPTGAVSATAQTWMDVDRRILRLNRESTPTTNIAMRAARFCAELNLKPDPVTQQRIREAMMSREFSPNEHRMLQTLEYAEQNNILEDLYRMMIVFNIPRLGSLTGRNLLEGLNRKKATRGLSAGNDKDPEGINRY